MLYARATAISNLEKDKGIDISFVNLEWDCSTFRLLLPWFKGLFLSGENGVEEPILMAKSLVVSGSCYKGHWIHVW